MTAPAPEPVDDRLNRVLINLAHTDAELTSRVMEAFALTSAVDRERVADQVMVEALTGMSFGLINHAAPGHTPLLAELAQMYAAAAKGYPWDADGAARIGRGPWGGMELFSVSLDRMCMSMAWEGLRLACRRASLDSLDFALAMLVHAWVARATAEGASDAERAMHHRTALTWLTDTLVDAITNQQKGTPDVCP